MALTGTASVTLCAVFQLFFGMFYTFLKVLHFYLILMPRAFIDDLNIWNYRDERLN